MGEKRELEAAVDKFAAEMKKRLISKHKKGWKNEPRRTTEKNCRNHSIR